MKLRNLIFFKFVLIISRFTIIIFIVELNLLGIGYAYFINTILLEFYNNIYTIWISSTAN